MIKLRAQTAAAAAPEFHRATASRVIRFLRRAGPMAFLALLALALPGCANRLNSGSSTAAASNNKSAIVHLYPDTIAVDTGRTITLTAHPGPLDPRQGWRYQWQRIVGESSDGGLRVENIREARSDSLVFREAQRENTGLYRCMIYRTGRQAETNYTAVYSLQVSGISRLTLTTVVSGSFKPGGGSGNDACCGAYRDGLVFKNASTGNWWLPPAGSHVGTATVTDLSNVNYTNYPACLEIVDGSFTTVACAKLPHAVQFSSDPSNGYMICLHFAGPVPPTGQNYSFQIKWP